MGRERERRGAPSDVALAPTAKDLVKNVLGDPEACFPQVLDGGLQIEQSVLGSGPQDA
jgi:hypothetical protein